MDNVGDDDALGDVDVDLPLLLEAEADANFGRGVTRVGGRVGLLLALLAFPCLEEADAVCVVQPLCSVPIVAGGLAFLILPSPLSIDPSTIT
jgi:hypothetical protein